MHSYPDHQPLVVYYAFLSSRLRLCDGRWKLVSYGAAGQVPASPMQHFARYVRRMTLTVAGLAESEQ
jgi:hypothetical protein